MEIGKTFTPAMIDSFLTIVKPDFVQVDYKGHPAYPSYPTKVSNQAGGYTKDILKIWFVEGGINDISLGVPMKRIFKNQKVTMKSRIRCGERFRIAFTNTN